MLSDHVLWFVAVGALTASMGTLGPLLKRYWVSAPQVHLLAGVALGPLGLGLVTLRWVEDAKLLEVLSEVAVIVSLYAAGMKMRLPVIDRRWVTPVALASLTMAATVALTTAAGWAVLGLPVAAALLLAAALAPTDPVLADEVQVEEPEDYDRLRLALTGEAGFNDGTAFPFVLLAVGLIGNYAGEDLHALGDGWWRWVAVDVVWKVIGGVGFGLLAGRLFGRALVVARERFGADVGAEELLTLGLIALTYGLALLIHTYAFLAVFAAAVALRGLEMGESGDEGTEEDESHAEAPGEGGDPAANELAREQTRVADALEGLAQLFLAVVIGLLLSPARFGDWRLWAFAGVAIFVVRPVAVYATTWFCDLSGTQRGLTAWFGIRGIGTIYYLSHGFTLGVAGAVPDTAERLADCAIVTIAASVLLHGFTVTPLMTRYAERHADDAGGVNPPSVPSRRRIPKKLSPRTSRRLDVLERPS